jgi:hypothetical protein
MIATSDTRFFKIIKSNGETLYLLYGDVMNYYNCQVLSQARYAAKLLGDKIEVVCNLYPLEETSDIPEIQKEKDERLNRYKKKHGYKLNSKIGFGKYKKIKTIKEIIDIDIVYWNWIKAKVNIVLHPEVNMYEKNKLK